MRQNGIVYLIGVFVVAGFAVAIVAGFNLGQSEGMATGRLWRDHGYTLEKATFGLNLDAEQRAKVQSVIDETSPRLATAEADALNRRHEIIDNALAQIRPILTPDQQKKLNELQKARDDVHSARDRLHVLIDR